MMGTTKEISRSFLELVFYAIGLGIALFIVIVLFIVLNEILTDMLFDGYLCSLG